MNGIQRLIAWHGPDPARIDVAQVVLQEDRLSARGTSCAADHVLDYRLDTGPGWVTRALSVRSSGEHGERRLELQRDEAGRWSARRWVDGQASAADLPDVDGALDCDLGLCPLTNTMPVLREGLLSRAVGTARLTMAWVAVPDLVVHASVQDYGPAVPVHGGGTAVRFAAEGSTTMIGLDADGLVVSYPGIAERLPSGSGH
jgi:uncharacterized protein